MAKKRRLQFLQPFMRRNWRRIKHSAADRHPFHNSMLSFWSLCLSHDCEDGGLPCYPPRDMPQGYLAIYVGRERKRFVIPALHLNHPVFKLLLEKAKEEYGFSQKGGLTMPFEVFLFERFMFLIGSDDPAAFEFDATELEQYYLQKYHLCVEKVPMDD